MIDFSKIEQYRENNRIEAKKALGGLPHSIWETYSAFANALGGIILLGVEEYRDKSLHTVDLPEPEKMVRDFWMLVNDPRKASVNILSGKDVSIQEVNGDHIIVITVPRADRTSKPVYVDGDPLNAYRRKGEGDYKCSGEELLAMRRDAAVMTQDMRVLSDKGLDSLNAESLRAYRQLMRLSRPGHAWDALEDEAFLTRLGAAGIGEDGLPHPTAAGLLMFGHEADIVREYPQYRLDYREACDDSRRWTDQLLSSSGDWSGNVFDFFLRVYRRLEQGVTVPFTREGPYRVLNTAVHQALREALVNCLVNADYYGRQGIVILNRGGEISLSNPGVFRVELGAARSGGVSDPRNDAMHKMFSMIHVGERSGGIANLYRVWRGQGWAEPRFTQSFEPDRTTLTLVLEKAGEEGPAAKPKSTRIGERQKAAVIEYLTDHPAAKASEIAGVLEVSSPRARAVLASLIADDIVVAEGGNGSRRYRLKA